MKSLWAGAALIGLVATSAAAETQFDRSIEQAAIDIAVGKLGGIRGGFAFDARPSLVAVQPQVPMLPRVEPVYVRTETVTREDVWQDGLAPAVEARTSHVVF